MVNKNTDPAFAYMDVDEEPKDNKKLIVGASVAALLLTGGLIGGVAMMNSGDDSTPKPEESNSANHMRSQDQSSNDPKPSSSPNVNQEVSIAEMTSDVKKRPEWVMQLSDNTSVLPEGDSWYDKVDDDTVDKAISAANTTTIDLAKKAGTSLPSEEAGYTSDDEKMFDADGFPNPMYSYWTADQFTLDSMMITQLLLNPEMGEWGKYQLPGSDPAKNFKATTFLPLLSADMKERVEKDPRALPIMADWNNDQYGMAGQFPEGGYRWYGTINGSKTEFTYDDSSNSYDAKMTMDITYSAALKNGSTIEKKGTLVLDLISGQKDGTQNARKVLIDNASLTMEG